MTTQPNSGEEKAERETAELEEVLTFLEYEGFHRPLEAFSQLRAERDDINNYIRAIATDHAPNYPNIGTIRPREQLYAIEATINGLLMAIGDLRAEHDKLKEELDKGKSAMKTMSDLFSVTSQKCGTLESDNARLAAEVERLTNLCEKHCADITSAEDEAVDWQSEVSRLTAELEAAKAQIKSHCEDWAETDTHVRNVAKKFLPETKVDGDTFYVPPIEDLVDLLYTELESVSATAKLSNELLEAAKVERDRAVENNKGLRQMMLKDDAERDALAGKVRELREKEESWKRLVLNLQSLLNSTPPDEGEKRATERDWSSDPSPYRHECSWCSKPFTGSISREVCKVCASPPNPEGDQISKGGESNDQAQVTQNSAPTSNPEGAGECPKCGSPLIGTGCQHCCLPRPEGDERDQCLCPECCPTTQGEKEYRMLEIGELVASGDEYLTSWNQWILSQLTIGHIMQPALAGRYRRPITPPTGGENILNENLMCSKDGCGCLAIYVETYNDQDCKVGWCSNHKPAKLDPGFGIRRLS